jgi:titin
VSALVASGGSPPTALAAPAGLFDWTQWTGFTQSALSKYTYYVDGYPYLYPVYSVAAEWQGKSTTPLTAPSVGDVFYVHIYTEVYDAWQATYRMRVLMPTGLQLVTPTAANDVYCAVTNHSNQVTRLMGECADPYMFGAYATFPAVSSGVNERLHFWFPVTATQPMSGTAADMQVLSDQTNNPGVSLPNPTLTTTRLWVVSASSTVPAAPTGLSAAAGNGSATISFTAGSNGGSAITNYQYSLNSGAWTSLSPADTTSPVTITGLTNGVTYNVQLRAVNAVGPGAASSSVSVKPAPTVPAAPTRLVASPRNGAASIAFRPGSNGGSAITNYQYSVNSGSWKSLSPADATSPVRVPGLTNGVLYSIRLRAVNAKGAGTASTAVSVRPSATAVVPGAPTYLSAKSGSTGTTAILSFWPGSDGGAAITNYQYSVNLGTWKSLSPADAASPITIPGLAKGTTYSIRIRAVNTKGAGASSAAVSVTTATTVPSAPTGLQASADVIFNPISGLFTYHGQASWTAPSSNGGSPITSYTVRWWNEASGGQAVLSCTTAALSCLSNDPASFLTEYYVDVVATNAVGTGPPSPRLAWQL